jgi:predicted RND superfamily exporter protein
MLTVSRLILPLRAFLVLLFGILVVFQTLSLPGQFAYMAKESPEDAYLRWPLTAIAIFVLLAGPSYWAYKQANGEVYYNLGSALPDYMQFVISQRKLEDTFQVGSTHMLLLNAGLPEKDVCDMIDEMEQVDGVQFVLGLESVTGRTIPRDFLPEKLLKELQGEHWELLLINSDYAVATDEVNAQLMETMQTLLSQQEKNA